VPFSGHSVESNSAVICSHCSGQFPGQLVLALTCKALWRSWWSFFRASVL